MTKQVNQDNPTLGQTNDTYDDSKVELSGKLRQHSNFSLGVILTAVEAALGDSKQSEALKSLIRSEMFALMERNQAEVYVQAGMQNYGLAIGEIHVNQREDGDFEYSNIRS